MNTLFIIFLFVALISFLNSWINNMRQVAFNNINQIYDRLELYVVQNNIVIDSKMASFLKSMKIFKINNEFADIHVLLVTLRSIPRDDFERNKKEYNNMLEKLPQGLLEIKRSFDSHVNRAITLSIFRYDFLLFFMYLTIKYLIRSILEKSSNKLRSLFQMTFELFKYDNLVVSKYSESSHYKVAV